MIPPLSNPFQRGALVAVSFVIGASLAYFSIRNAFAVHVTGLQTREGCERAIYLEPGDARNWHVLGRFWQYNLENPDGPRAIRAYLAALSLNPGSADIWLDLATAYESEGNLAAARDAFLHARRAYPPPSADRKRFPVPFMLDPASKRSSIAFFLRLAVLTWM